jgi:2-isopropylmalate synthase
MSAEIKPNQVRIFETTLRDGFQSPGVNVSPEHRLEIAGLLARMGVDIIEAGFPISSQENFESVRAIALAVNGPIICGLSRTGPKDVDRCWEAVEPAGSKGGARIHVFIATSEVHMKDKLKMTPEEVVRHAKEAATRAKQYTPDVEFSPEDASRSDFNFMMRVVLEAVNAGATTINIPDTVGYAQPLEFGKRIAEVKRRIDEHIGKDVVVLSAHCHNDLGLATANTLAAVMAGARQVEVTMNGIGERAGNTSLEEVVATLLHRPDFYVANGAPLFTKIDPQYIFEASELVAKRSGMVVQPNKAIVGANAFAHESGIHSAGVQANPLTYEIMKPETFGQRQTKIIIGAESGHSAIISRATELGFVIKDSDRIALTAKVKEYANEKRRALADTELEQIFAAFTDEVLSENMFTIEHLNLSSSDQNSEAEIMMFVEGKECVVKGHGNGPIEAAINAIKTITGLNIDILEWSGKSLEGGAKADSGSEVTIQVDGKRISGYAENESVPYAAIYAYVSALNTAKRTQQRTTKAP